MMAGKEGGGLQNEAKNKTTATKSRCTIKLGAIFAFTTNSSKEKCLNILGKEKKRMGQFRIQRDKKSMIELER